MSIGRNHRDGEGRDIAADYLAAYIAEFESYRTAGNYEKANEVAVVLRQLGHQVDKVPTGTKERAVSDPAVEQAVPTESAPPKRRGRPPKGE